MSAVCLLNGLVELQHMESALPWALLAIGGVGLATFVVYQLRASAPLLNLRLFAYRQVSIGSMVAFAHGFAIFSSVYLLPMFLQTALAYSPSRSGFTLLPAGLVLAFTIPWGGRLADRHPPGPLVTGGLLVLVVSLLLTANVTQATPYALVLVWVALGRMGIGVMGPALQLGSLRGLALSDIPQAASITSFVRQFGGAAGVSVVASVLQWRMMANGLGVEPAEGSRSFIQAFEETFWFIAIFSGIAAMAGWFLSPKTAKKRHAV